MELIVRIRVEVEDEAAPSENVQLEKAAEAIELCLHRPDRPVLIDGHFYRVSNGKMETIFAADKERSVGTPFHLKDDFREFTGVSAIEVYEAVVGACRAPALIAANGLPPVAPGEMISIMGVPCVVDSTVPKGSIDLRDANGRLLKRIVNVREG